MCFVTEPPEGSQTESAISHFDQSQSEFNENRTIGPNQWGIELWGLSPGILEDDVEMSFLGSDCNLTLHYL